AHEGAGWGVHEIKGRLGMKTLAILSTCVLAFTGLTETLSAQVTATATLQGTVTDKTVAVIPNAEVRVSNRQTGETRSAVSNNAGLDAFSLLPAGYYDVRISVQGFTTAAF